MRAGLSTIQQTLTPEASSVLNHSIAEASRRNHGQTTPLHVAATLLSSPSGFLRQACIRSHPNSSHPLQCRALELCFSVALERLPTAQNMSPGMEPPISNALMAALKRAQAHQRRGCPEQQQQPLLAVKVELEQLIISILDDPSVSRVMREASFSSPAVKATIEQTLNNSSSPGNVNPVNIGIGGIGFRPSPSPSPMNLPNRNLYLNPRLQQGSQAQAQLGQQRNDDIPVNRNLYLNPRLQGGNSGQSGQQRSDDVKRVIEILLRTKKRNPVLVGESEPQPVLKEILRKIEKGELVEENLNGVQVISIEKELYSDKALVVSKIKELGELIGDQIGSPDCGGVIVDLGDLKWLVEQPTSVGAPQQVGSEVGREAVVEMGRLLGRFGEEGGGGSCKIWLVGTATCETYLRCQVYHPSMESDWDLQAVPIASRSPLPGMFPRMATTGILSSSVESLNPLKSLTTALSIPRRLSENVDPARKVLCCPQCSASCEQELAKLAHNEVERSGDEVKSASRPPLPQWLQNAKVQTGGDAKTIDQSQNKDQESILKQKTQELHKKWSDTCSRLHPNFHHIPRSERMAPMSLPMTTGLFNSNLLMRQQSVQPKLQPPKNLKTALQLNPNQGASQLGERPSSPPSSPVRTDLVLGPRKVAETTSPKVHEDPPVKDLLGCISSQPKARSPEFQKGKFASAVDADSFKKLLKGLMKKAWWQPEAASAVATTVTQGTGSKGSTWLLFAGPDRVGKKKMASVLAEHVCGANPITICLGARRDDEELDLSFRGKTALDRIAEAVRRNPFSVIILADIDEADMLVCGSIKRAMERGRLVDSHGREISLGNIIFILTGNWSTVSLEEQLLDEKRLDSVASGGWQLKLTLGERRAKRRANWLLNKERAATRARRELNFGLSLDLNQAADFEEDRTEGSLNSSDLTVEREDEHALEDRVFSVTSVPHELVSASEGAIVFKPVHFGQIRREIEKTVVQAFSTVVDDKLRIEVDESSLERILAGLWCGRAGLEEWAEDVLIPSFKQIKARLPSEENLVVRLESDRDSDCEQGMINGDRLPSRITVLVDGV